MTSWTTTVPPVTDPVPPQGGVAPRDDAPRELLVAVREPTDLLGTLTQAVAVQERRRHRDTASTVASARAVCRRAGAVTPEVVVLRPAWAWTRRGREHRLADRLVALARSRGAELHARTWTGAGAGGAAPAGAVTR